MLKNTYVLELPIENQKEIGFRYDPDIDDYAYRFPVYKNDGEPFVYCKIWTDEGTNKVLYRVCNSNNTLYAGYYNTQYGANDINKIIDNNIVKGLKKLGAVRIISICDKKEKSI